MTEHINPCSKCGKMPHVNNVVGLWYIQCVPCERIEVHPLKKTVIEHWNVLNELAKKYTNVGKRPRTEFVHKYRSIPVYRLDENGNRVEKFRSAMALCKALGLKTRKYETRLQRAIDGTVEIEGIKYVRDKTEATPTSASRRSKKQTAN